MFETRSYLYTLTDNENNQVLVGNIFYWRGADVTQDRMIADILSDHPGFSCEDVHLYDPHELDARHVDIAVRYNVEHSRITVGTCKQRFKDPYEIKVESWKARKIHLVKSLYGATYDAFMGYDDDRQVFIHTMDMILEALESMPNEPDNYVKTAMNHEIQKDMDLMNEIMDEFRSESEE